MELVRLFWVVAAAFLALAEEPWGLQQPQEMKHTLSLRHREDSFDWGTAMDERHLAGFEDNTVLRMPRRCRGCICHEFIGIPRDQ